MGTFFGNLFNRWTGSGLTDAENEANRFNAQQAQQSMDFSAQQAEIARDWQEQQYLQYNSPEALVRQYQNAGINPALMFGGQTPAASMSTSSPSGVAASSVAPNTAGLSGITGALGMLGSLSKLKAEIGLINAQRDEKRSNIEHNNADRARIEVETRFLPVLQDIAKRKGEEEISNLRSDRVSKLIEQYWRPRVLAQEISNGKANVSYLQASILKVAQDIAESSSRERLNDVKIDSERAAQALTASQVALNNVLKDKYGSEISLNDILSGKYSSEKDSIDIDVMRKELEYEYQHITGHHMDENLWQWLTNELGSDFVNGGYKQW